MRRRLPMLALALALGLVTTGCSDPEPRDSSFGSAALDDVEGAPTEDAPEPTVSRTMAAAATLSTYGPPLDACDGPVAIDVEVEGRPLLVAEHDYCGGADWIPDLEAGDVVALDGDGVDDGLYRVDVVDEHARRQARVTDLRPEADVVLQTCISQTRLILVAATRID